MLSNAASLISQLMSDVLSKWLLIELNKAIRYTKIVLCTSSFLWVGFGRAVSSLDGPDADQQKCTATDSPPLYWRYQSTKRVFLLDDFLALPMYGDVLKLGMKYEFRIWMHEKIANIYNFRVRITTFGPSVSCNAPQTLVYMEARPTHAGCCGKQIQCKHVGDVEIRDYGHLKSCIYKCECVDARCQCSHLVIRFYYTPWFGDSLLDGQLYHLVGIS